MEVHVLKPIKHNGKRYKVGEVLTADEKTAKRLITLGAAAVYVAASNIVENKSNENRSINPETDSILNPININNELGDPDDILSDEEVYQLIWDEFKLDSLKEQAEEIGLEFPGNITKGDLINLIIKEEQENYFLEQIPE